MSFAGISVFPVEEEYNVTITLISSGGSDIGSKSSPTPSTISALPETIKSLLSSFPNPALKSYIGTISPAFPPDTYFEVFSAFTLNKLSPDHPPLLSSHATAYCTNLPKNKSASILFLDFSNPTRFSTAYLKSSEADGKQEITTVHEESIASIPEKFTQEVLKKAITFGGNSNEPLERIVVHDAPTQTASIIDTFLSAEHPNVPIFKTTPENISQAAASLLYARSLLPHHRILAQYVVPLPISIATSSRSVVTLVPAIYRIPVDEFITLTTSMDSQTSVTVRLLLGNHPLAKDNLQRGIAVLDGLKPMPKGAARIKASIKVSHMDGWRDAAEIQIEQQDGPSKTFIFPNFFANLTDDDDKYEIGSEDEDEDGYEQHSDKVVGDLPSN